MELRTETVLASLEMSEVKSDGGSSEGDEDYESLPAHASLCTHMTAGAVAGVLEHTVMYPVDSVKTRMQSLQPDPKAQYRSVYGALKRIVRTEGLLRPLRGLNITVLGAGPAHALYFACYERIKRSLSDVIQNGGNSHIANVVKQRMQMYNSPYRSLYDCVLTVSRKEGLAAFYRSYSTQLTMNIPFQAVHFITRRTWRSAAHTFGMVNALRTVYRLGGVPAFFKGIRARVIYQMPSTAIAWSVYEFFKYFLTQQEPHIQELRRDAHKASPT
ncbi:hypothetical protein cypCar_00000330 [Cyprinus carpio]|nr:hypothetical protein cypCar_00000330 [Cyprinus carpio]